MTISAPFTVQKSNALRIMSWNVEHFDILEHKTHPEKKQEMLDLINEYQPDIACFQEMVSGDKSPQAINYLPDFMQRLNFADNFYSYNPKLDFDGDHHFGIIIFSRYPIISKQTISFYPNDYNSIFQYIDIKKGNDTLRIFNIHLQSLKFSNTNRKYIDSPEFEDQEAIKQSKNIIGKFKVGFLKRRLQADRVRQEMVDIEREPTRSVSGMKGARIHIASSATQQRDEIPRLKARLSAISTERSQIALELRRLSR